MLARSLLEWPAQIPMRARPTEALASALIEKPSDPIGSEEWTPTRENTFDALWRTRVEQR